MDGGLLAPRHSRAFPARAAGVDAAVRGVGHGAERWDFRSHEIRRTLLGSAARRSRIIWRRWRPTSAALIIRPFSTRRSNEIIAAPRFYGFDTGFVCHYRGWKLSLRPDDLGRLWEHYVLNELCAHLQSPALRYWRDKQGMRSISCGCRRGRNPIPRSSASGLRATSIPPAWWFLPGPIPRRNCWSRHGMRRLRSRGLTTGPGYGS